MKLSYKSIFIGLFAFFILQNECFTQTTALWLFDEQQDIYPSSVLNDYSDNDYPLVIGLGGTLSDGKFGNALEPKEHPKIDIPDLGEGRFGLGKVRMEEGRTAKPMTWWNANFCALMTNGENHLRKEVGFKHPTESDLNLGDFNWTVEFWFKATNSTEKEGVVFEIGEGPRGENDHITSLLLNADRNTFLLSNQPSGNTVSIKTDGKKFNSKNPEWHHLAFVYSEKSNTIKHYIDGELVSTSEPAELKSLWPGEEDYMSIGRNGSWDYPLQGKIDELRFSKGMVYTKEFTPPGSFSPLFNNNVFPKVNLVKGPPLLFEKGENSKVIDLGNRKFLFIDDTLLSEQKNVKFVVNPPVRADRVIDNIEGQFRKHLTVVEDKDGLIRIYNSIHDDYLAVRVSKDGSHFTVPDLGFHYRDQTNIVIPEMVGGLGNPFIDPNGPDEYRWKYITGYHRRAIFLYTSPDGYKWTRFKISVLPFRSGTQSCTFYDDQRQLYVGYHRTGIFHTLAGATQRGSVVTQVKDLFKPWDYKPLTQQDYLDSAKVMRLREPLPWYLDNGPLTPGGFGLEFPHRFDPIPEDPVGTDIYVTKAQKYEWAPDTYLAFPIVYYHYEQDGPPARQELMNPERNRGSGPIETQISVSRDGINWKRYPRPAYIGIGEQNGRQTFTAYIADGMVRRGNEIWQYYFGENQYHSSYVNRKKKNAVYRVVQRLDGFISADTPYDKLGYMTTKPIKFEGNRLVLNIDTDAAGYAQVGFLDENNIPIKGFSVDDCLYINGDFINTEVEWMKNGKDISVLQGKIVKLVFRSRGTKIYSMQFVKK